MLGRQAGQGAGGDDRPLLMHAQLVENISVVKACVAGNFAGVVACGTLLALNHVVASWLLAAGFAAFLTVASVRLTIPVLTRRYAAGDPRLARVYVALTALATNLGMFWGLMGFIVLTSGVRQVEVVGGIIVAGMLGAGAIAFRTMRAGALAYVILCGLGMVLGLVAANEPEAWIGASLVICYVLVLCANIVATSDRFDQGVWRERQLSDAADTIKLLLDDFTDQGMGWIIDVDQAGRIQNPCERMIAFTGRGENELSGMRFGLLIEPGPELSRVRSRFREGKIIRQQILPLTVDGQTKWISLTARPKQEKDSGYRGVITDVTSQRHAEERVSFLAHYDVLTKLPNRLLFNDTLTQAIKRHSGRVAVMYLDLDNFKTINDTLGHPVGDNVLVEVARRIESVIGQHDLACRFGGDEFVILVAGSRVDRIERLAKRIITEVSLPIALDQSEIETSCSIGIAVGPDDGAIADCLIRRADLALYLAKSEGRRNAMRFRPEMEEAAHARRSIESELGNALRNGEFEVQYQALVGAGDGAITGYEALVRWRHAERGLIMPSSFIPIAEETGLIINLGDWVIRQAIADAATWPEETSVSINLSPVQLRSPALLGTLMQAISKSGIDPGRVCLEITESVLMQDSAANIQALHRLRDFGMKIALDDFGTGFSSLNYLRTFPFSKIKIDRCFVAEIEDNPDCQAIVRSVVSLANSLGMSTIAEGIERESQAELLCAEGCLELQGFLYGEAIGAQQVTDAFERQAAKVIAA